MNDNPLLGVTMYVLGGLAGASFYVPIKYVKSWGWESSWMIYAITALVVAPWVTALALVPNMAQVLLHSDRQTLLLCLAFGAIWGVGGLTWGLMIRYLGVGLGLAIGAGVCASLGTLMPPVVRGEFRQLLQTSAGNATLAGVVVAVLGIVAVGMAGMCKEAELSAEQKKEGVADYNFKRGVVVAVFSGVMSAGMAMGIRAGDPMRELAASLEPVTNTLWQGLPVLTVVFAGGESVNIVWCLLLNLKNQTGRDYVDTASSLSANYVLSVLAGLIWYLQWMTYTMGDGYIGAYKFSGWSLLLSSIVIFSTLFGIALKEWKGTSTRTRSLLGIGLTLLIASLVSVGKVGFSATDLGFCGMNGPFSRVVLA